MRAPHLTQAEAGRTIDFPPGIRTMQTFKKLPMISPKTNTKTAMSVPEPKNQRATSPGGPGSHKSNVPHPPESLKPPTRDRARLLTHTTHSPHSIARFPGSPSD